MASWKIICLFRHGSFSSTLFVKFQGVYLVLSDLALKSNDEVLHTKCCTRSHEQDDQDVCEHFSLTKYSLFTLIQNQCLSGVPQFFPTLWLAGQKFFARHLSKALLFELPCFVQGQQLHDTKL